MAITIGIVGASASLGIALGAKNAAQTIRATELNLKIGEVLQIEIVNYAR